jgi:hypothetical protein
LRSAGALSVFVAPAVVLFVGLIIRGRLAVPGTSAVAVLGVLFLFGTFQFGGFFLAVGLVTGWFGAFSAKRGLATRVLAVLLPMVLFPVAAVGAIVWSNRGGWPLIQDTRPYFVGGFPAGLLVGVVTLLFAARVSRKWSGQVVPA